MIETVCPDLCQDYKIDITITRDAEGEKTSPQGIIIESQKAIHN